MWGDVLVHLPPFFFSAHSDPSATDSKADISGNADEDVDGCGEDVEFAAVVELLSFVGAAVASRPEDEVEEEDVWRRREGGGGQEDEEEGEEEESSGGTTATGGPPATDAATLITWGL